MVRDGLCGEQTGAAIHGTGVSFALAVVKRREYVCDFLRLKTNNSLTKQIYKKNNF